MVSFFLIKSTCLLLLIHIISPSVGESCIEAQSQLSEGAGGICNGILTSGTIYNLDNNTINTFCEKNDCPKVLSTIYASITKACGGGVPSGPDDPFYNLLQESCWQHNRTDCLTLWRIYIYPLQTGVNNTFTINYNLCVQDYALSRTNCTDNCKTALSNIVSDLGCCYDAIERIGFPFIGSDMVRACSATIPICDTDKKKKYNNKLV